MRVVADFIIILAIQRALWYQRLLVNSLIFERWWKYPIDRTTSLNRVRLNSDFYNWGLVKSNSFRWSLSRVATVLLFIAVQNIRIGRARRRLGTAFIEVSSLAGLCGLPVGLDQILLLNVSFAAEAWAIRNHSQSQTLLKATPAAVPIQRCNRAVLVQVALVRLAVCFLALILRTLFFVNASAKKSLFL
jgi:hypothetical protein